jgi:hypothetical protein
MEGESVSRLAIVIPSVSSVEALESTLLAVLENRPQRSDVIVVHAHPYTDPYQLEGEVRLIHAPSRSSYVACANLGIRETSADVVHLLSAGSLVREGWTDGALRHFADPRVAVVAPLLLDEAEPTHAVSAGLTYTAGGTRRATTHFVADVHDQGVSPILAASLAAVFYNRVTLTSVGGLSAEVGADLADIDLGLLLRHAGFTSLVDPRLQVRIPNRPLEQMSAFRSAVRAERLFWRNAPLLGWGRSMLAHPMTVMGEVLKAFPGMGMFTGVAGHLVGAGMWSSARRHHQRLMDLRNSAPVPVEVEPRTLRIDHSHGSKPLRKTESAKAA